MSIDENFSKNKDKLKESLASLALEGITPSKEAVDDAMLFSEGKISEKECIDRAIARAKDKSIDSKNSDS